MFILDYKELPIGKYQEIDKIVNDTSTDELEKQVAVISVLCDKTEEELLRLPLPEYTTHAACTEFLRNPLGEVPAVKKEYKVGDFTLLPCKDYTKLTAGQYIDFQSFTKAGVDYCGLLSVLLVPKGCRYGEGYDVADVRQAVADNLMMPDGMALIAFFLKQYANLIKASLNFSMQEVRRMKDQRKKKELQARIEQAQALLRIGGVG